MAMQYTLSIGSELHGNQYKYKIEKVLGQGTFGITYLAEVVLQGQLGQLDSHAYVAVKEFFMKEINGREGTSVTSSSNTQGGLFYEYKEKFAREAKNLSKLKHPNIVKVMDYFEENNTCYYVMEFLSGGDLDTLIVKRCGLDEDETIGYTKQIGAALSFMHKNKMLHLDLKPKNIMLVSNGAISLIDFGLSKQYNSNGEPESSTKVGAGTPGYAPIEQVNYREGKGFPVTMDIYALGATMFKMLTGVRPPEASDILNEGFPIFDLKERNITDRTTSAILKAMAPAKKDRFQSVEDFMSCFEEDVTIIDNEIIVPIKERNNEKEYPHLYKILPSTKKIDISFSPRTPSMIGLYNAVITKNEILFSCPIKQSVWSISQKSFSQFLLSLSSLNLEIREKTNQEYFEASEVAAKLSISLYDDNNYLYAKYWIGGWKNQFGNIIGETLSINERLLEIVPHLHEFIDLAYFKNRKECLESMSKLKLLQIPPDTYKVRIEYWPYTLLPPRYNGAFVTTVTQYEVNPNVTQESTRNFIPMTEVRFKTFLKDLQSLNLQIREEAIEQSDPGSFSPAKLKIIIYGKSMGSGTVFWVDGRFGGNIVGNVNTIEKQIIQIVPGLADYLNSPFYEVPDLLKEKEIRQRVDKQLIDKGVIPDNAVELKPRNNKLSISLVILKYVIICLMIASWGDRFSLHWPFYLPLWGISSCWIVFFSFNYLKNPFEVKGNKWKWLNILVPFIINPTIYTGPISFFWRKSMDIYSQHSFFDFFSSEWLFECSVLLFVYSLIIYFTNKMSGTFIRIIAFLSALSGSLMIFCW